MLNSNCKVLLFFCPNMCITYNSVTSEEHRDQQPGWINQTVFCREKSLQALHPSAFRVCVAQTKSKQMSRLVCFHSQSNQTFTVLSWLEEHISFLCFLSSKPTAGSSCNQGGLIFVTIRCLMFYDNVCRLGIWAWTHEHKYSTIKKIDISVYI